MHPFTYNMAPNADDGNFLNDEPVTSNVKDVKPLPTDVAEEDIDETVHNNPELRMLIRLVSTKII